MLQYYNNVNNKNTVNEKVQDKNKNKANDVHSKKEKPGKEFLFPTVFAEFDVFRVIPRGVWCHSERRTGVEEFASANRPLDCRSR